MKRFLFLLSSLMAMVLAPLAAPAYPIAVQHVYVNGDVLTPSILNPNIATIVTWANGGVEAVNIGPLGIYASNIKPTSPTQATLGGTWGYTVTDTTAGQVTLTVAAPTGQTADIADFTLAGAVKFFIDSAGGAHGTTLALTTPLAIGGGGTGSAAQNFVDLTTAQSVGGAKTFTGTLSAAGVTLSSGSFTGSGANLTGIPGSAITGGVVTSVSGTGNIASTGGSTPTISISNNPSFSGSLSASGGLTSGSGLNTGGPILGATTGSFSSDVTIGGVNHVIFNSSALGGQIRGDGVNDLILQGGTAGAVYIQNNAGAQNNAHFPDPGGLILDRGGLTSTAPAQAASDGGTRAYVPPIYNSDGTATASTVHSVIKTNVGCTSQSTGTPNTIGTCTITLAFSGATVFASPTSYGCWFTQILSSPTSNVTAQPYSQSKSSTSDSVYIVASAGGVVLAFDVICTGT